MDIKSEIIKILRAAGVSGEIDLSAPPKPEMGDYAFACFGLAKELKMNPVEAAKKIATVISTTHLLRSVRAPEESLSTPNSPSGDSSSLRSLGMTTKGVRNDIIASVQAFGPYVNFFLNAKCLAEIVLQEKISAKGGPASGGKKQKIMVEFAHPNTHKAFHIGHLRNITTGESIARILNYVGHKVIRVNYQGDVGMHIAKCLWGILQSQKSKVKSQNLTEKIQLLAKAYVAGSAAYESDEKSKQEIIAINDQIYSGDKSLKKLYQETRAWSLEYFDKIYKRVGSHFDRFYFESETYQNGIKIVKEFLKKGVFETGEGGAIIFPGSKYGLHDRVFITAKGFPTYEAKDQALARVQFKEYKPDKILHVVGKEQIEYFKVIFKALEFTCPQSKNKEEHLNYGWVSLKDGKMSSRTGNVVLGEWLLDNVKQEVGGIMRGNEQGEQVDADTAEKIAVAAVKYAFLRTGVKNDIEFDLKESISLTGNSGVYLLYILARIKSILRKAGKLPKRYSIPEADEIKPEEKNLLLRLSQFDEAGQKAAQDYDPSQIAQYLFNLARAFNDFYEKCPVLSASNDVKNFRLNLIDKVSQVVEKGLYLLGIEAVEAM